MGVTRILVVEDDPTIRTALLRALTRAGHVATSVPDAASALRAVVDEVPEVVLLDLGLPDLDGIEVLRMLRGVTQAPVIVVTARTADEDVVRALDAGADDFVAKPFRAATLEARIRAVLRRSATGEDQAGPISVGDLVVDVRTREASWAGTVLELAPKEFELLALLAARAGTVVSKREIMAEVWRQPYGGAEKTVDVHLAWLRKKIAAVGGSPSMLVTLRGVGVKLVAVDPQGPPP